jgi:hypothetical protein
MEPGELPKDPDQLSDVSSQISNESISSSEIPQEIKDKVKFTLRNKKPAVMPAEDSDSDVNDINLESAFDFYEVMNAQEKLCAIKARATALKKKAT